MRQRFNELMDDAFTLFGSAGSSPPSHDTFIVDTEKDSGEKDKKKRGKMVTILKRLDYLYHNWMANLLMMVYCLKSHIFV